MLKSLFLSEINWTLCSAGILRDTLANLGGIEVLELNAVNFRGLDEAVEILCAFPLLKSVSVVRFGWGIDGLDYSPAIARHQQRPPLDVHVIDLDSIWSNELMEWLFNPIPSIHTIRSRPFANTYSWTHRILTSVGGSIQKVEINNEGFNSGEPMCSCSLNNDCRHFTLFVRNHVSC
jgi:hypothetical protein